MRFIKVQGRRFVAIEPDIFIPINTDINPGNVNAGAQATIV